MKRRIKRAVLHLKDFVGRMFNRVRDGVTVSRSGQKGLEHQHVECALQHVASAVLWVLSGHEAILPEEYLVVNSIVEIMCFLYRIELTKIVS